MNPCIVLGVSGCVLVCGVLVASIVRDLWRKRKARNRRGPILTRWQ